jgi:hypothetical protein
MSLQYRNKSKSQLTSPTPAQLPAVALSGGHIVYHTPNASLRSAFSRKKIQKKIPKFFSNIISKKDFQKNISNYFSKNKKTFMPKLLRM